MNTKTVLFTILTGFTILSISSAMAQTSSVKSSGSSRIIKEAIATNKFYIDSELVISYESYGLILPSDDSEWIRIINKFFIDKKDDIQMLINEQIIAPPTPASQPDSQPTNRQDDKGSEVIN